jgi:hypothetical protein
MKRTLTLLTISCISISAVAQQPQNGGFENWTGSTLYMESPPYLGTGLQSYFTVGTGNVYSVPSPVQGVSAAHLETVSNGTDTVYGGMFWGVPGGNGFTGGGAYNERPDSLVFWANHNVMAGDTATIIVALEFMNNMLGYAPGFVVGNSGGWVRYSVPFQYFAAFNPDSIGCLISSTNIFSGYAGTPGSMLEIDSIQLIGATAQVANPYFEVWSSAIVTEPDGWATLNIGNIYDGNYSVTPDNGAYMGNYDCLIETTIAEWGDTIGYITNASFTGSGGGMAVYQNPQKITGYYKYIPVGNDSALAGGWSSRWDVIGDSAMPVEEMFIWLPAASSWTYFEVNLSYNGFPNPDTLALAFASSNFDGVVNTIGIGSMLYLDEIGVSYYPLGMEDANTSAVSVFPNPTTRFINVRLEEIAAGENTFSIYDAQGNLVKSEQIVNGGQTGFYTMELNELPAGTYVWEIVGAEGKTSSTFVKQ